jgi:hypothetical protein
MGRAGGGRADAVELVPEANEAPEDTVFCFETGELTVAGDYTVTAEYSETRPELTKVRHGSHPGPLQAGSTLVRKHQQLSRRAQGVCVLLQRKGRRVVLALARASGGCACWERGCTLRHRTPAAQGTETSHH